MSIIEDKDYQKCCEIIGRLEDLEGDFMGDLLVCLSANYKEVREYIINYYEELLEDVGDYD